MVDSRKETARSTTLHDTCKTPVTQQLVIVNEMQDKQPHDKREWFVYPASVSTRNVAEFSISWWSSPVSLGTPPAGYNGSELFSLFPRAESGTAAAERSEPTDERPAALYPYRLMMHPRPLGGCCTADIRAVLRPRSFAKPI